MVACKEEHFLPRNVAWNKVLITHKGKYPSVTKEILPVLCNHCQEAPCLKVCPTNATSKREDGIIVVDYDKCMGCRYCVIACPYQNRVFLNKLEELFPGFGITPFEEIGRELYPLQTGTTVKCNFCLEKIDEGLKKGLKPGIDREATPACVTICPAKARYFGDLDDPNSEVSKLIREKKGVTLHPELGTDCSVYYLKY
jgi:molybdopterin-containing oxidoreductase family iron-sulfur binding subunit